MFDVMHPSASKHALFYVKDVSAQPCPTLLDHDYVSVEAVMSGRVMDMAIAHVGGKQWSLQYLQEPRCGPCAPTSPLSLTDFLQGACRPLKKGVKSVSVLFDAHIALPEFGGVPAVGEMFASNRLQELPASIKLRSPIPSSTKVDVIIYNSGDGCMDVLKVLYFEEPLPYQQAVSLCSGQAYVPVFRAGPWNIKKGVQWLLGRLPGYQVRWQNLQEKAPEQLQRMNSQSSWSPPTEELAEGIAFINDNAPECDARNEQTFWILTNIKDSTNTPISGWPEAKVRAMAQNKSKGLAGAQPMSQFPLQTYSLKPILHEVLLPLLYPMLMSFGVIMLGYPGVGKTPALIIMAMAMGRFHVRRLGLEGVLPGWRRAKSLDNFRHRVPQVQEAIFLDDPSRDRISAADLKSFMTVDEDGTCDGRYNDTRLVRNQMRAYASNDLAKDTFDGNASDTSLEPKKFLELLRYLFAGDSEKDTLAVLKRAIVFAFAESAVYLRLPSEKSDAVVHRICVDDLHRDLLSERDKPLYAKYKVGVYETGQYFEEEVAREKSMIDDAVAKMSDFPRLADYVEHANDKIQSYLFRRTAFDWDRIPQPSPSSSEGEKRAQRAQPSPLCIGTKPRANRIRSAFVYPDNKKRRFREKTTPTPTQEHGPEEENSCMDFEAAGPEEENGSAQTDSEADEEVAKSLHN